MIKQSRKLFYFLITVHILAVVACVNNGLAFFYQLFFLFIVIGSAFFYFHKFYHFKPYQIRYSELSGWQLAESAHDFQTMQILPTSVLTAQLLVLHFRLKTRKQYSLLIFNDALNTQDYRTLLVDLKISGLQKDKA